MNTRSILIKYFYLLTLICVFMFTGVRIHAQSVLELNNEVKALEQKLNNLKQQKAALRDIRVIEIQLAEKKKILEEKLALNNKIPDMLTKVELTRFYHDLKGKYPNPSVLRENLSESFNGKIIRLEGYVVTHFWKTIEQSWLEGSNWMQMGQSFFVISENAYGMSEEMATKYDYCSFPGSTENYVNLFFKFDSNETGITATDNAVMKSPFNNKLLKKPLTQADCKVLECKAVSYEAHKFCFFLRAKYEVEAEIASVSLQSINGEWTQMHNYLNDAVEFRLKNVHFKLIQEK